MQIYSKNNKYCFFSLISWPIFILFVLSDRARWRLQNSYTKFWHSLIMLIYANLRSPGRDPGVQLFFCFFFFFYYYYYFFFFFHVPSGASNLYFSHSNFFIFSPFPGHQIFIFWPVENCTTWNLRYLMLRDAGWALRHWRSCLLLLVLCQIFSILFSFCGRHHYRALAYDGGLLLFSPTILCYQNLITNMFNNNILL